jgi:hypothetical protein
MLGAMPDLGDTVPAPEAGPTAVRLVQPDACPNGHPKPRHHWRPCRCQPGRSGHHLWLCDVCGDEILAPPHLADR